MNDSSSFGIIGIVLVAIIVFLIIKFAWWILIIGGLLILLFIFLLARSSKKAKGEGGTSDLEGQVRNALSSIRQQKFKSDAKIKMMLLILLMEIYLATSFLELLYMNNMTK